MKRTTPPQLNLFNEDLSGAADASQYTLFLISPEKGQMTFKGALSFDKAAQYVRDNHSSGTIQHDATEQRAQFRSGKFYGLHSFPVVNFFSQPGFALPEVEFFTSSEKKAPG